MKQQQYLINYVRTNGKESNLYKQITISRNVIVEALEIFLDKKFEDGNYINEVIKIIILNKTQEEVLKNGIIFNDTKYIPLLTSPSMQKKEESEGEGKDKITYKMEYIFIKEEHKEFVNKFEEILSLNKSKDWEGKEMSIVKDISARLGLATSGTYKIKHNPSFIVLKEETYSYLSKKQYVAFKDGDYSKVEKIDNTKEHTLFDGVGLMSNNMANIIQKQLHKDYRVDFAIIRGYNGLAIKGVCLRFNWNKYFRENYTEDTEYIRKTQDGFEILDKFGKWRNSNVDMLLTESQVKWLKNWTNLEEWEETKQQFDNKYNSIINSLYITKINKDPKKLKTHTLTNYQLLNNLAITTEEMEQLSKATEDYFSRVVDMDIDAIRLFLGDSISEEGSRINTSSKIHYLLQTIGGNVLEIPEYKRCIARYITKKIKLLAGGKFYVEGGYKILTCCPVSFCNWIMTRSTGDNGLQAKEFYIPTMQDKKIVIARNPIASFQEIQKTTLTNKLDKWCGDYTSELMFMNEKDDSAMIQSGSDKDGDGVLVTTKKIIYDSVIEPKEIFVNIADDKSKAVKHNYSKEQRYLDEIASSGNLIGKIANATSVINSRCQSYGYYFNKDLSIYKTWIELKKIYCDKKDIPEEDRKNDEVVEKFKKQLDKQIKKGSLIRMKNVPLEKQKEVIRTLFYNKSIDSYIAIQLSMMAIDAPKTLQMPNSDDLKALNKYMLAKKPRFMLYAKEDITKDETTYYESTLDINALRIASSLLKKDLKLCSGTMGKITKENKKSTLLKELNKIKTTETANKHIKALYSEYSDFRKNTDYYRKLFNLDDKTPKNEVHKIKKLYFIKKYREIVKDLSIEKAALSLYTKQASANFLIDIAWDTVQAVLEQNYLNNVTSYIKDENGNIDWLFNKYRVVNAKADDNKLLNKDIVAFTKKIDKVTKLSFRKKDDIDIKEGQILTKVGNQLVTENGEIYDLFEDKVKLFNDNTKLEVLDYKINKKSVQIEVKVID